MKLKNSIVFLLMAIFAFGTMNAQFDCARALQMYTQSAKAQEYDDALPYYEKLVENCPTSHKSIYQYGTRMFSFYYDSSTTEADKKKYAQAIIDNYTKQLEYYPENNKELKAAMLKRIATLMFEHDLGTTEEKYDAFDKCYKTFSEGFTDPRALYTYFSLMVKLQDEGKRELEDVFEKYDDVIDIIETEEAARAEELEQLRNKKDAGQSLTEEEETIWQNNENVYLPSYQTARESMDAILGSRADCANLIPLYNKNFEDNKNDLHWLRIAAQRLATKRCSQDDRALFVKITEALHKLDPSAKSAKYLGQLAEQDGNTSKALELYKQSAELETKKLDKAQIHYRIAGIYKKQGSFSAARAEYRKALNSNPSLGNAYLQIADMIGKSANDCGDNLFEKQAVYWLAAQYAERAGSVQPALKATANQAVASYNGRAPSRRDIFNNEMEGKTVNVKCWINESIKVPSL